MNISSINPIVIISVIISAVIVFNILIFLRFKNRPQNTGSETISSFIDTAKNPWRKEEKDLEELSKLLRQAEQANKDNNPTSGGS